MSECDQIMIWADTQICCYVCRFACTYKSAFMTTSMCEAVCVSTTQCVALPHQPSSGRPNIAQRRHLLPLLSCLAPIHSIIPHSAAHIHPLFPCLFSKDVSSLAKYMLAIIFHCKQFKDTSQGWRAHHAAQRDTLHKVTWWRRSVSAAAFTLNLLATC